MFCNILQPNFTSLLNLAALSKYKVLLCASLCSPACLCNYVATEQIKETHIILQGTAFTKTRSAKVKIFFESILAYFNIEITISFFLAQAGGRYLKMQTS